MPRNRAERIRSKLRAYATDPASQANNVSRLKGQDALLRLRVGDWRIIMRDGSTLHVLNVAGRGSAYRGVNILNEMVSIPKVEYERLRALEEDLEDTRAALAVEARIASGEEELIPGSIVDRLIDREPPLRVWREYRALSQSALARSSGVSRVQIVEIEAGRKSGSVHTLHKLANALGIAVDDLIPASDTIEQPGD